MPKSEDGQYELVLENRQVLVIFLFAAVLCGIFFGLGFVVGQSSKGSPTATTAKDAGTPAEKSAGNKKSALSPPEPVAEPAKETPAAAAPEAKGDAKSDAKPAETPAPAPSKPEEKPAPAPQPAAAI